MSSSLSKSIESKQKSQICKNQCLYALKIHSQLQQIQHVYQNEFKQQVVQNNQWFQRKSTSYIMVIRLSLFQKYAQSQNYYYTRDINEILSEAITRNTVKYKDMITYDDVDEYLKRIYFQTEYNSKINLLSEYYKFHTDIPRLFMEPINTLLNKFYDKKRKYEYYRIAKLIEEENRKNPERPPKGIVGDRPSPINSLEAEEEEWEQKKYLVKETLILKDLTIIRQNKNISCTLSEICKQLEKQKPDDKNIQDDTMALQQSLLPIETSKLNNFIKYLRRSQVSNNQTGTVNPQKQQIPHQQLQVQKTTSKHIKPASPPTAQVKPEFVREKFSLHLNIQPDKQKLENAIKKQLALINQAKLQNNHRIQSDQGENVLKKIQSSLQKQQIMSARTHHQTENDNNQKSGQSGQSISHNVSPTAKGASMQKRDLFQPQKKPVVQQQLQTLQLDEDLSHSIFKFIKQPLTHRPSSSTQFYFQNIQKQNYDNQNKGRPSQNQLPSNNHFQFVPSVQQIQPSSITKTSLHKNTNQPEMKKLSLGCLDHLGQAQLSNRSNQQNTPQYKLANYYDSEQNSLQKQFLHKRNTSQNPEWTQSLQSGSLTDRSQKGENHFLKMEEIQTKQRAPRTAIGAQKIQVSQLANNINCFKMTKGQNYDILSSISPQIFQRQYQKIQLVKNNESNQRNLFKDREKKKESTHERPKSKMSNSNKK